MKNKNIRPNLWKIKPFWHLRIYFLYCGHYAPHFHWNRRRYFAFLCPVPVNACKTMTFLHFLLTFFNPGQECPLSVPRDRKWNSCPTTFLPWVKKKLNWLKFLFQTGNCINSGGIGPTFLPKLRPQIENSYWVFKKAIQCTYPHQNRTVRKISLWIRPKLHRYKADFKNLKQGYLWNQ